ncbi:hypothetical protein ACFRCI_40725 [Streptomyces sp. NPDC056638]|uniref:hypothetical protein n=1 Tax=Streptomyces sp. NPDC056638 TaxID=3345887 RepID=UPI0036B093BC
MLGVDDLSIAAVRGRVGGSGGVTGAPQVEHDQPAPLRQSTEITEAGTGTHGPTEVAEQRLALTHEAADECRCRQGR